MEIAEILTCGKKQNCSDVHISSGACPMFRIDGEIVAMPNAEILSSKQILEMLDSIMDKQQKKIYEEKLDFDFAITIGDNLRFRVNAFNTISGPAAAFREILPDVSSLLDLGVPASVHALSSAQKGLILVVGPTGSGKSTTISALIDQINSNYQSHIITIEDPVEFLHKNKKSLVNQREVGNNTPSFASALRGALREDPDVILVGEMRDLETIDLALTAAATGHLVFATLHTNSAAQSISRIVDVFPAQDKISVRSTLSSSIKAVISQRLIKKKGGGRCAVFEVMIANTSIRNLIREDKIPQINSIIEISKRSGMTSMKDSINDLLARGVIEEEIAKEALSAEE